MSEKKHPQISIDLTGEGVYSNLAIITHSPAEFVVDFVSIMPNVPKAKVKSRIILTPQNAKRLLKALSENVSRYEAQYGVIKDSPESDAMDMIRYSGPHGMA
jgi:hypothetical protein